MALDIREDSKALVFSVYVQPRASANQVAGLQGEALKIRLTSPPVEGAANKALIEFMAQYLELAKSRIQVVKGGHSRHKQLRVEGISREWLMEKLAI